MSDIKASLEKLLKNQQAAREAAKEQAQKLRQATANVLEAQTEAPSPSQSSTPK